jgi:hypothetical protein
LLIHGIKNCLKLLNLQSQKQPTDKTSTNNNTSFWLPENRLSPWNGAKKPQVFPSCIPNYRADCTLFYKKNLYPLQSNKLNHSLRDSEASAAEGMRRQVAPTSNPLPFQTEFDRSGSRLGRRGRRYFHQANRVLRFSRPTGTRLAAKERPHLPLVALAAVEFWPLHESVGFAVADETIAGGTAEALGVEFVVSCDHHWTCYHLQREKCLVWIEYFLIGQF